ncbi:MAG: hypothetical protein ACOCZQ_00445 [Nanoarchaeota archaeon]
MDIEKLKKVNHLATTLRSQGLVSGRDEAANLAGQMSWEEEDNVDHIFKDNDQPAPDRKCEMGDSQPEKQQEIKGNVYNEEKMIEVLQKFADQFNAEINKLNEKINEQEETIRQIAQRIVSMSEENSSAEKDTSEKQQSQQQLKTEQEEQKSEDKPRSGDYNSSDVSIEDFFYFGQK